MQKFKKILPLLSLVLIFIIALLVFKTEIFNSDENNIKENNDTNNISNEITVKFKLEIPDEIWISETDVKVEKDSTVYDVLIKVFKEKNFKNIGANDNYTTSITHSNGTQLKACDKGPNSGWLYKVNDKIPQVGIKDYKLKANDSIIYYYTLDWSKEFN